jgi:hypothetical protein
MLPNAVLAHVERLCGKTNFARRRQLFPYTFFYPDAAVSVAVCVLVLTAL